MSEEPEVEVGLSKRRALFGGRDWASAVAALGLDTACPGLQEQSAGPWLLEGRDPARFKEASCFFRGVSQGLVGN